MDVSRGAFDRLVRGFYDAALNECGWRDVVADVETVFGAPGASIIDLDVSRAQVTGIVTHGLEPAQDDYATRMNAINPRMKRALSQLGPHVAVDYDGLPEEGIRRHEFYAWLERECGVKYFIGARMQDDGPSLSFLSVEFTAAHGPASEEEVEFFRRVVPHAANAWRLSGKLARLQADAHAAALALDSTGVATLGLNAHGLIVSANRAAEQVLLAADGLFSLDRKLYSARSAADRTLQIAIANALSCANGRGGNARRVLAIPRPSRQRDYIVEISALAGRAGRMPDDVPVIFVFIRDPDAMSIGPGKLQDIYGLTRREAEIAVALQQGAALPQTARVLGIAHNTARAHLASIFKKTGCASRAELVALIARAGF